MASNFDEQECAGSIKKKKIDYSTAVTLETNLEMDVNLFSEKNCAPSEILEGAGLPGSRITPISTEQVLTGGDSGFSEIEMTPSVEEYPQNTKSPLFENELRSPLPGSSNFDSSMEIQDDLNDNDDISSTISDLSCISDLSGQDWKPTAGPMSWIYHQMATGANPRDLLLQLVQDKAAIPVLPPGKDDFTLWKIIISMLSEPPRRKKLSTINTLEDAINLIKKSQNIMVLTGAGVSVSCGIPDFRSPNGIYSRLAIDFPDLPDPQAMFDIQYFNKDPRPFFKFARDIYPGQFKPSPCHKFIQALEQKGKLLRNYTQNIDTLEQVAGIKKVIQCHGSFATASCTRCKRKVGADEIRDDVFAQKIPICESCHTDDLLPLNLEDKLAYRDLVCRGIMKPDITFFGEGLPEDFHEAMAEDKDKCDLLIVIGSSLKVRPVALIPSSIPSSVPQILINLEPLPHLNFDVELLGESDVIVDHICRLLGEEWENLCWRDSPLIETSQLLPEPMETQNNQKQDSEAEDVTNQINSQTEILVGKVSNHKYGHKVQEAKMDCNENCRKRSLSSEYSETGSKRLKLTEEKTNIITQSLRDVRVGSVDSVVDSGEGESVCSDTCGLRDLKPGVAGFIKERQMSMDSTRDSGIGESSREVETEKIRTSTDEDNEADVDDIDDEDEDDGTCWQPKKRIPISRRLPENTYFFIRPNRYVFQGAEVYSTTTRIKNAERNSRESDDLGSDSESEMSDLPDQL